MLFGRLPRPDNARFLNLSNYATLPPAPRAWGIPEGASFNLYDNDVHGNCVVAELGNHASLQAAAEGRPGLQFDTKKVDDFYFKLTGGADAGLVMVDTMHAVTRDGFPGDGSYLIPHFAGVDHTDQALICAAAFRFVGLAIGVALPDDWRVGWDDGLWEATKRPNPYNGHAVLFAGYDDLGPEIISWGQRIPASWDWFEAYCQEAYSLLDASRFSATVLNAKLLIEDLAVLAAETGQGG